MNPTPTLDDGRREPVDVDVDRLLSDPIYAADECLRVYRVMRAKCGDNWQCCYRRGVKGCAGRGM